MRTASCPEYVRLERCPNILRPSLKGKTYLPLSDEEIETIDVEEMLSLI
jgi:hypothetical protein